MPSRIQFFFELKGDRTAGWSENFWNVYDPGNSSLDAAVGAMADALNTAHGRQTVLTYIRVSNALTARDVEVASRTGVPAAVTGADQDSDYPTSSGLLVLKGDLRSVTRQWMRGLDDSAIKGARWNPTAKHLAQLVKVYGLLQDSAQGWRLRVTDRTVALKPVKTIDPVVGSVEVTGHGYDDNSYVRLMRMADYRVANKLWRITRVDADHFKLQGWPPAEPVQIYRGRGVARAQTYIFKAIVDARITRATSHRVGRPFGLLGGRQRPRSRG